MDGQKGRFILAAGILAIYAAVVLSTVAMCLTYSGEIVSGKFVCDQSNRVIDLLIGAPGVVALLLSGEKK